MTEYYPRRAYDPELSGFWDIIGKIGEKLRKITPEQALKAGEVVGAFKKGKKGKRGVPPPGPMPAQPPAPVLGLGIDTTTLLLLLGGAGLAIYLLVRK